MTTATKKPRTKKEEPPYVEPKAPHADCTHCPLSARPLVKGFGPAKADVVVVGEAPGYNEEVQGRPFVGRSGQLLNRLLEHHGLERDDVYVTNSVLCRPANNATPKTKEIKACRERLIAEINARSPKMVLTMGGPAAQSVLNTHEGVTNLRVGGARPAEDIPGALVIPTFHPAYALRNPDILPTITKDMEVLTSVQVGWEPTQVFVCDEPRDAPRWLERQAAFPELALDIENDVPRGESPNAHETDWLCIGIAHEVGKAAVYTKRVVESPEFQRTLEAVFASRKNRWVYQNGKYDVQHLWAFAPSARVDEDTMLLHFSVDERKGTHGLESLATEYLHAPNYKTAAKSHLKYKDSPFSELPTDLLYQYNATDTDVTLRLMEPLRKEAAQDGVERIYNEWLIPASHALARAEYQGVRIDTERLAQTTKEYEARIVDLEGRLRAWIGNPRSPKQVLEALAELGYDAGSSARLVLEELQSQRPHEFIDTLLEHRDAAKFLGTYLNGITKRAYRERVHPSYLLHGTETGRLSCRNPNLQNQPRRGNIRDLYIAEEGHTFVAADYNAIEYRFAAIYSKDRYLCEAFREGRNLHEEAAQDYYGPRYKGKKYDEEKYTVVKTVNFGILYGETPGHLAARLHIPFREAKALVNNFNRRAPGLRRWQKQLAREIEERQWVQNVFGRKRRFWLLTDENRYDIYKEGYNFPLQSTASDVTLRSFIRLQEPLKKFNALPLITVHDSIVVQTPIGSEIDVARVMKQVMEDTEFDVPLTVEIKIGPVWGKMEEWEDGR